MAAVDLKQEPAPLQRVERTANGGEVEATFGGEDGVRDADAGAVGLRVGGEQQCEQQ